MRLGKLTPEELDKYIFNNLGSKRAETVAGAGLGIDCAEIKTDGNIILTSDPITGAVKDIGVLSIHISANDIAAAGGEPYVCMLTVLMDKDSTGEDVGVIMEGASAIATELDIEIVGGHTEFTDAVSRPVVFCTMFGKRNGEFEKVQTGDKVYITKHLGIEGITILVNDCADRLKLSGFELSEAKGFGKLLSVLPESRIAMNAGVSAMHDITEGGIIGAIEELEGAIGHKVKTNLNNVPVHPLTKKITSQLKLDVMTLIGSGSMLIVTGNGDKLMLAMRDAGIECTLIGEVK